jgi:hypothetical protein
MTDAELIEFAMSFREGILDGTPSDMMCAAVSWPLAALLRCSGMDCTTEEAKDIPTCFGTCNHVWIRLADGRVLDPTADQFGEQYLPVYLGPPIEIHRDSGSRSSEPRRGTRLGPEAGRTVREAKSPNLRRDS